EPIRGTSHGMLPGSLCARILQKAAGNMPAAAGRMPGLPDTTSGNLCFICVNLWLTLSHETARTRCRLRNFAPAASVQRVHRPAESAGAARIDGGSGEKAR